jgi:hypothetical protein
VKVYRDHGDTDGCHATLNRPSPIDGVKETGCRVLGTSQGTSSNTDEVASQQIQGEIERHIDLTGEALCV